MVEIEWPSGSPPTIARYDDWLRGEDQMLRREYDELSSGGLVGVFDRVDLSSIYPSSEFEALERAVATGRCRRFVYPSSGQRVSGYLLLPSVVDVPRPAIVYARGGNRSFGSVDTGTLLNLMRLADAGYVVAATQYRGGPGSDGADELGGRDVDDLLNLITLVASHRDVDAQNVFLWGVSRGGMMTMLALRRGTRPRAVALRAPMLDLTETADLRPDMRGLFAQLMPDYSANPERALRARSALAWPELLPDVPILTLHGGLDARVPVSQSTRLDQALREFGHPSQCHIYPDDAHLLILHREDYLRRVRTWFDEHRIADERQLPPTVT